MITLICAMVMALFSVGAGVRSGAETYARDQGSAAPMTPGERRTYRLTLAGLVVLWLVVVGTFLPWGLAAPR